MDPVAMEGSKGEPVALQQKLAVVKALSPKTHSQELAPLPAAFRKIVAEELAAMESMSASNGAPVFCSPAFAASLKAFLEGHVSDLPAAHSKNMLKHHVFTSNEIGHLFA